MAKADPAQALKVQMDALVSRLTAELRNMPPDRVPQLIDMMCWRQMWLSSRHYPEVRRRVFMGLGMAVPAPTPQPSAPAPEPDDDEPLTFGEAYGDTRTVRLSETYRREKAAPTPHQPAAWRATQGQERTPGVKRRQWLRQVQAGVSSLETALDAWCARRGG